MAKINVGPNFQTSGNGISANIVITLDGQMSIITREGSFDEGKARIEAILASLDLEGIKVDLDRPVEQHKHGPNGETVSGQIKDLLRG